MELFTATVNSFDLPLMYGSDQASGESQLDVLVSVKFRVQLEKN